MEHWVRSPILQANKLLGPIFSWCKKDEESKLFIGEKFNAPVEVIVPSQSEYQSIAAGSDWSLEETIYLCELLRIYNLNFIVVCDRYDYNGKSRSVESIKEVIQILPSNTTI